MPQCVDLQVKRIKDLSIYFQSLLSNDMLQFFLSFCSQKAGDPKFLFEAKTIQRMELVVLTTLKWRMQALTPLAFVDYFVCKISNDKHTSMSFICRSTELILSIIKGLSSYKLIYMCYRLLINFVEINEFNVVLVGN